MTREEYLKMHAHNKGAGRISQKIVRTKMDISDGVLRCETHAEFVRNGVIHSLDAIDIGMLACGHHGKPVLLCQEHAQEGLAPHEVCSDCAARCVGCAANLCAHHAAVIDDVPYCGECASQLAWNRIFNSFTGAIGRLLS
jgi:hypothetical protein